MGGEGRGEGGGRERERDREGFLSSCTYLFINSSRPFFLSSIKSSSNIPTQRACTHSHQPTNHIHKELYFLNPGSTKHLLSFTVISSEWQLSLDSFTGQWGNHNLIKIEYSI